MTAPAPQLPWESDTEYRASIAHDTLLDRATADGRDTLSALCWLCATCPDVPALVWYGVADKLSAKLTDNERTTFLIWREGTAAHLVPAVMAKHSADARAGVARIRGRMAA